MIAGWKLDPNWRMYYEMKEHARHQRRKATREQKEYEEQMRAIDEAAQQILSHVAAEAKHRNVTKH